MPEHSPSASDEPWRARLEAPNYPIWEAAKYVHLAPRTISEWHSGKRHAGPALSERRGDGAISYLQLIEVAVVASFRKAGVPLDRIRKARSYLASSFGIDYPFARIRFRSDGKDLLADSDQFFGEKGKKKLFNANRHGQLEWTDIIGSRLKEFEYEGDLALKWHVRGPDRPI